MLNIKENLADKSNYGNKRNISNIRYIVMHFTANDGDSDEGNANYFKRPGLKASAHYFVDDDSVTRSVRDENIAWHCGGAIYNDVKSTGGAKLKGKVTNANSIGVEMCDTQKDKLYNVSVKTRDNALKLVRSLMEKYGVPVSNVVRHFDVTGKYCPRYYCPPYGSNAEWDRFKADLVVEVKASENKKDVVKKTSVAVKAYRVKVSTSSLNIRSGPGTSYSVRGAIKDRGVYTITEQSGSWGKLKSGAGWIHLGYTKKV